MTMVSQPPSLQYLTSAMPENADDDEYGDYLMARRAMVIMELRDLERRLIKRGRLRQESLPRRMR